MSYDYDELGRKTATHYPDGKEVRYAYNQQNQLTTVTQPQGETQYQYDGLGRPTGITYPNGVSTLYTYEGDEHLTQVATHKASGDLVNDMSFQYDANGNVIAETIRLPKVTQEKNYEYDENDQLLKSIVKEGNRVTETAYMYDELGNRLFYEVTENGKK